MAGVTDLINAIQFQQQNRRETSPFARIGELLQQELIKQQEKKAYADKISEQEKIREQRREEYLDLISREDLPSGLNVSLDGQGRISYQLKNKAPVSPNQALYKQAWAIASDMAGEYADPIAKISMMPKAVSVLQGDFSAGNAPGEDQPDPTPKRSFLDIILGRNDPRYDTPQQTESIPIPQSAGVGPYLKNIKKADAGNAPATVNVAMPDGTTWAVPRNKVSEAIKRGGKLAK